MPALRYPNLKFHSEPNWRSYTRTPIAAVPTALRNWLLDRNSLTQRLIEASGGAFRVEILKQRMERPQLSEIRALGIPSHQKALVREVILFGNNEPWVYARSIIPIKTLTGRLRSLRKLDNRPLGALLFNDRSMQRGDIEIACLDGSSLSQAKHTASHALALFFEKRSPEKVAPDTTISANTLFDKPTGTIWGRRSIFYLDKKPLLVSEMFLPGFKPYNASLPTHFNR